MWRHIKKVTMAVSVTLFGMLLLLLAADGFLIGSNLVLFSRQAQSRFPGTRVEALMALVNCQSCGRRDRNHAVWALGQLDDARALPVLESSARTDPQSLDPETLRIALRHLRHEDINRSESFLWRWMLPNEKALPHS